MLEYPQASGGGTVTRDFKSGELRYSQNAVTGGGTAVFSLENGAVLKREKGAAGSLMAAEPRWYFDADGENSGTLVIVLTKLEGERRYSSGGIRDIRLSMTTAPETVDEDYVTARGGHAPLGAQTISLEYIPDRENDLSKGWENYLTGGIAGGNSGGGFKKSGTKYVFENVKRLVVKTYTITVEDM